MCSCRVLETWPIFWPSSRDPTAASPAKLHLVWKELRSAYQSHTHSLSSWRAPCGADEGQTVWSNCKIWRNFSLCEQAKSYPLEVPLITNCLTMEEFLPPVSKLNPICSMCRFLQFACLTELPRFVMAHGHPRRSRPLSAVATRGVTTNVTGLFVKGISCPQTFPKTARAGKFQRAVGDVTADFS